MQETAGDASIWMKIAGFGLAAWNALLTLILGQQFLENRALRQSIKEVSGEREEHCIPRPECERTHAALNERLDRFESEMRTGITGIHKRLDKVIGGIHER